MGPDQFQNGYQMGYPKNQGWDQVTFRSNKFMILLGLKFYY